MDEIETLATIEDGTSTTTSASPKKVTDPELIKKLEAASKPEVKVTDPELIKKLEAAHSAQNKATFEADKAAQAKSETPAQRAAGARLKSEEGLVKAEDLPADVSKSAGSATQATLTKHGVNDKIAAGAAAAVETAGIAASTVLGGGAAVKGAKIGEKVIEKAPGLASDVGKVIKHTVKGGVTATKAEPIIKPLAEALSKSTGMTEENARRVLLATRIGSHAGTHGITVAGEVINTGSGAVKGADLGVTIYKARRVLREQLKELDDAAAATKKLSLKDATFATGAIEAAKD